MSHQSPLWSPDPSRVNDAFISKLKHRHRFTSYEELHKWSVENLNEFWSGVWDDGEIIGEKGKEFFRLGTDFISTDFFSDARLNTGQNILARATKAPDGEIAVISIEENGNRKELTWQELYLQVSKVIQALKSEGIKPGDRIVAWVPNLIEVLVFAIAGISVGAIVSTSSPDFAPSAVADRFGQISPRLLLAADSYSYGGKKFDCLEKLQEIVRLLPTVEKVIIITSSDQSPSLGKQFLAWNQWTDQFPETEILFEKFPFNHPGFILFSSGTTGKPKCITHSAAGILLKLVVEHRYHFDFTEKDRVLFFTTCGWMMWNWILYILASGASIILYEGSPIYPNLKRLFDVASNEEASVLGLSAKLIDSARKENLALQSDHRLEKLRTIISTGSVLNPESFDFVYSNIHKKAHLVSMSGGTDICGCFLIGNPTLPVFRGELQSECLGMAMDVFDDQGESTEIGVKGELVCLKPFPSKPLNFWGDNKDLKYRSAYFQGFPDVWTHGDFASKSENGGFKLFGRSDATLNSKGVRIGTSEIYRVVETFPEVVEAMAVAQDWDDDTRIVLFLVMASGKTLDQSLEKDIRVALRNQASPRHVPDKIVVAPELPRTKSNKLVELAVTDIINGRPVRNRDALSNQKALDWFLNLPELQN